MRQNIVLCRELAGRGFTLIELVVAILVMGILSAIAQNPMYVNQIQRRAVVMQLPPLQQSRKPKSATE